MKIAFVGDISIDQYKNYGLYPGGCSLNSSYWYSKEKRNFKLFSYLGNDNYGEILNHLINDAEIPAEIIPKQSPTPIQELSIINGEKSLGTYHSGLWKDMNHNSLLEKIKDYYPDYIVLPVFKETLSLARKLKESINTKYILDFHSLSDCKLTEIKDLIDSSHLSFFGLNKDETLLIKELLLFENTIITLGRDGIKYFSGDIQIEEIVNTVDTTGAGDAFIAYFISHYQDHEDIESSLIYAKNKVLPVLKQTGASLPGPIIIDKAISTIMK